MAEHTSARPQSAAPPIAARFALAIAERLASGTLDLTLPNGERRRYGGAQPGPAAQLDVRDWAFFRRVLNGGALGFAEAYMDGQCDTPDLVALVTMLAVNEKRFQNISDGSWWRKLIARLAHLRKPNDRAGSQKNIHAHYDLGNEFYRLWLDPTMSYSSALYEGDARRPMEEAQRAKYRRILDRLNARQGETVLEIGCGWGGFAEEAARRGLRVTGVTISREQLAYARERLARADLAHLASIEYCDYRDIKGRFDHIVSIEMIEAVGERFWPDYFAALKRHLNPGGTALVQAILIADDMFGAYRRSADFIQTHVFPGGMLLSPATLAEQARQAGLRLAHSYSFGLDYARTLEHWLERFDSVTHDVRTLGFDERFQRLWRYYLAYCAAGFATARTDVVQAEFAHV